MVKLKEMGCGPCKVYVVEGNVKLEDSIRLHLDEKICKVKTLLDNIVDIRVWFSKVRYNYVVDMCVKFSHFKIKVSAETGGVRASIDKAIDRLCSKIRKWRGKIKGHQARGCSISVLEADVLSSDVDDEDEALDEMGDLEVETESFLKKVVKKKQFFLKKLFLDEAVMKMDLSGDNFMLFKSEEDCGLKVMYRRRDGSYGIIAVVENDS